MHLNFTSGGVVYIDAGLDYLRELAVPSADILIAAKAALSARVDADAEALRLKVLTAGAGQAIEYQEAAAQAFAALTDPATASAAKYPMLAASIGIDTDPQTKAPAADVLGVARSVVAAYSGWVALGSEIRRVRLSSKAVIAGAASIEDAQAAFDAIAWPALG